MIRATVTAAFKGRRDDSPRTVEIEVGATITGDLAKVAVANGWAVNAAMPPEPAPPDAPAQAPAAQKPPEPVAAPQAPAVPVEGASPVAPPAAPAT